MLSSSPPGKGSGEAENGFSQALFYEPYVDRQSSDIEWVGFEAIVQRIAWLRSRRHISAQLHICSPCYDGPLPEVGEVTEAHHLRDSEAFQSWVFTELL